MAVLLLKRIFHICINAVNVIESRKACENGNRAGRLELNMALLLWLLVALVPFLLGKGALRILYGNQMTQEWSLSDNVLTGWMLCIGLAEAVHLGAVAAGWSFLRTVSIFTVLIGIGCLVMAGVLLVNKKKNSTQKPQQTRQLKNPEKLVWTAFGVLALMQLIYVMTMQSVYVQSDMTLESVNSFIDSDAIYQINPLTGKEYTAGMPMRLRILCLPTLYAILAQGFQLDTEMLVYGMIPALVLVGCYLAYGTLAKKLFPKKPFSSGVFMILVAILLMAGDYSYGMDGFGVLHSGFRGVSIRAAILLPYTVGLMLRRKYKLVVLCILTEACIVWTLYGMGACFLVAAVMLCLEILSKYLATRQNRKEK